LIFFYYLSYKYNHRVKREQASTSEQAHKEIPLRYFGRFQLV
jgi:hypothetical protein